MSCWTENCGLKNSRNTAVPSLLSDQIQHALHYIDLVPSWTSEPSRSQSFTRQLAKHATFVTSFPTFIHEFGVATTHTRSNVDYSIVALRKAVPLSLDAVPLSSIHKYFRRATHSMQAYSKWCTYKLDEYAHKKYKSHRQILDHQLDQIWLEIAS